MWEIERAGGEEKNEQTRRGGSKIKKDGAGKAARVGGFNCNKSTVAVILDGEGVGEGERGLVGRATARVTYEESATGVATSASAPAKASSRDFFAVQELRAPVVVCRYTHREDLLELHSTLALRPERNERSNLQVLAAYLPRSLLYSRFGQSRAPMCSIESISPRVPSPSAQLGVVLPGRCSEKSRQLGRLLNSCDELGLLQRVTMHMVSSDGRDRWIASVVG